MSFYKKIFKDGGVYLLGNIFRGFLLMLFIPLYAKYLSASEFGIFSLLTITISLVSIFIQTPVLSALIRFFYNPDFAKTQKTLVFNLFVLLIIKSTLLVIIFYLSSGYISKLLFDNTYGHLLKIISFSIILTPISSYYLELLRLRNKTVKYIIIQNGALLVTFVFIIIGLSKGFGLYALVTGNLLTSLLIIIGGSVEFVKSIDIVFNFRILQKPLQYSYPLLITGYSQILFQSGDRYILRLLTNLNSVGIYDFGYKIAGFFSIAVGDPLNKTLGPIILQSESNPKEHRRFLKEGTTYLYIVIMFFGLSISLFSQEIVKLFSAGNADFVQSWYIVPFVVFGYVQHALGYFVGYGLMFMNKSFMISFVMVIALVSNILLNYILIPSTGIVGAAIATALSYIVWNVLKIYYSSKYYQLQFQVYRLIFITLIGIGLYLPSVFISSNLNIFATIGLKTMLCLFFPVIFYYGRFFSKQEKKDLQNTLIKIRTGEYRLIHSNKK